MRRREHRRLAVAVISTVIAIPLLIVEVAPGADASPDASPAAFLGAEVLDTFEPEPPPEAAPEPDGDGLPRAVVTVSGDDLAAPRLLAIFSGGDALRAQAEADDLAAEQEREAELEAERRRQAEEAAAAEREAERRRQAEEAAAAEAAAPPPPPAPPAPAEAPAAGGPSPEQWRALRQCESSNNYQAVSRNGLYFGAYQFYPGTWDNTARLAGRDDLIGVRPDSASPADQDAMALALWQRRGSQPWPHCGVHLR
jgi:multidrug efflux pump subunit AcrA (membrane-fusion protein)